MTLSQSSYHETIFDVKYENQGSKNHKILLFDFCFQSTFVSIRI